MISSLKNLKKIALTKEVTNIPSWPCKYFRTMEMESKKLSTVSFIRINKRIMFYLNRYFKMCKKLLAFLKKNQLIKNLTRPLASMRSCKSLKTIKTPKHHLSSNTREMTLPTMLRFTSQTRRKSKMIYLLKSQM